MSTPTPTQAALLQATRQQLDELDALLERMLALPVVELPEEQTAAEAEVGVASSPPPLSRGGEREEEKAPGREESSPLPKGILWRELGQQSTSAAPLSARRERTAGDPASSTEPQSVESSEREQPLLEEPGSDTDEARAGWAWQPLLVINQSFDLG